MAKEITASVTERGQVTIPAEIRKLLGIDQPGQVTFRVKNGEITLVRPRFTIDTAFGSITPLRSPEDWEARKHEALEAIAADSDHRAHET